MEVRPGYKQTAVGVVPEEWDIKQFAELFAFRNGVNADRESYGQGVRFINVLEPITYSHLYGPEITGQVTLPESVAASYAVRKGDVLFNRTSETQEEVGLAATYLGVEEVVFGGFVIRGRPIDQSLDPIYSGYALRAPFIRSQIIPMGQGAIRANIGQQNLSLVVAPVPPLPEQRAIAESLSDVDALLGALNQLIAKKRDLKQAAMQQLLTGQTRLPGFHGDWEVKRFADVAFPRRDRVDPRRTGVHEFCVELEHIESASGILLGSTSTGDQSSLKSVFCAGDVLFGKLRAYLRKYWLATRSGVCSTEIWVFVPNDCLITTGYLFQLIKTDQFIEAASNAYGTHMPRSDWNVVKNYEMKVPPLPEQTAIAEVLSDMDAGLAALEQRRDKTRALKQGMMQELLTGRTRLV
ncbi:MAG: hypothetical protein A3F74_11325 [Betaproteobacteria bacterium RIFCSPLOWO2_12_FULL_62_58]|nr:MAG: hypothetical protein A3F74_11325 [Betaproteobacteria bacterium RIFCSPLOWO2_12_FULL_62_58]